MATQCKKCRRVVFDEDVDKDGYCCFCSPQPKKEAKAGKKKLSEIFDDKKED